MYEDNEFENKGIRETHKSVDRRGKTPPYSQNQVYDPYKDKRDKGVLASDEEAKRNRGGSGGGGGNAPYVHNQPQEPRKPKKKFSFLNLVIVIALFGVGIGLGIAVGRGFGVNEANQAQVEEQLTKEDVKVLVEEMYESGELKITEEDKGEFEKLVSSIDGQGNSTSAVFAKASPSVVSINIRGTQATIFNQVLEVESAGSGIVYGEDDEKVFIVTNHHVIEGADEASISFDDEVQVPAHYIGDMPAMDLAVIGVNKADLEEAGVTDFTIAEFADSDEVCVGDTALAIGNALGQGKTATSGIVSAKNKSFVTQTGNQVEAIQIDAAINKGNSGGALVDNLGRVIGVNTAKLSSAQDGIEGMGFAIPSNQVIDIVEQILETGEAGYPTLGVTGAMISEQTKAAYNLPAKGFLIDEYYQGGTAESAGIQRGDIITSINGEVIESVDHVRAIINACTVGDTINFGIIRQGHNGFEEMEVSGTVQSIQQEAKF